jgi:hypothetical protein
MHFDDISSSLGRAFTIWIKSHASPEAAVEYGADSVFFDVVDENAVWIE